jgi:hypothetical protein
VKWPTRRLELWHPSSPGLRVIVDRCWPRYLWTPGPDEDGRPRAFAGLSEVLRAYKRDRPPAVCVLCLHPLPPPKWWHLGMRPWTCPDDHGCWIRFRDGMLNGTLQWVQPIPPPGTGQPLVERVDP